MKKCIIYKNCQSVPCGKSMNKCKPSYCYPTSNSTSRASSKNWGYCNMANISKKYKKKYKRFCKTEKNCILKKTRKYKNSVDISILHNKMPYIWRFLKPKTRKYMVDLAKKSIKEINIPFTIFPDPKKNVSINKTVKNILNSLDKKQKKHFKSLRKKYKDI